MGCKQNRGALMQMVTALIPAALPTASSGGTGTPLNSDFHAALTSSLSNAGVPNSQKPGAGAPAANMQELCTGGVGPVLRHVNVTPTSDVRSAAARLMGKATITGQETNAQIAVSEENTTKVTTGDEGNRNAVISSASEISIPGTTLTETKFIFAAYGNTANIVSKSDLENSASATPATLSSKPAHETNRNQPSVPTPENNFQLSVSPATPTVALPVITLAVDEKPSGPFPRLPSSATSSGLAASAAQSMVNVSSVTGPDSSQGTFPTTSLSSPAQAFTEPALKIASTGTSVEPVAVPDAVPQNISTTFATAPSVENKFTPAIAQFPTVIPPWGATNFDAKPLPADPRAGVMLTENSAPTGMRTPENQNDVKMVTTEMASLSAPLTQAVKAKETPSAFLMTSNTQPTTAFDIPSAAVISSPLPDSRVKVIPSVSTNDAQHIVETAAQTAEPGLALTSVSPSAPKTQIKAVVVASQESSGPQSSFVSQQSDAQAVISEISTANQSNKILPVENTRTTAATTPGIAIESTTTLAVDTQQTCVTTKNIFPTNNKISPARSTHGNNSTSELATPHFSTPTLPVRLATATSSATNEDLTTDNSASDLSISTISGVEFVAPNFEENSASGLEPSAEAPSNSKQLSSTSGSEPSSAAPINSILANVSASNTNLSQEIGAPIITKDVVATLIPMPPTPQAPAVQPAPAMPVLPQAHQMLDAAPVATPTAMRPSGLVAELQNNLLGHDGQLNTQLHVGMRTDSFGVVEIHTVVQQSQIGLTVHADRDVSRWFSSEVPSLESGLNKSHLNLVGVDFGHGQSGIQTATSFQQGQPQHGSSQPSTPRPTSVPDFSVSEPDTAADVSETTILPADLSIATGQCRVSIHV